jgi:hypothetical protein
MIRADRELLADLARMHATIPSLCAYRHPNAIMRNSYGWPL